MTETEKEAKKNLMAERARVEKAIAATIRKAADELRANSAAKEKNCLKDCYPTMITVCSSRIAQLHKYMGKINKGLDLLEKGKYGICCVCGEPIPTARLRACPATDICISCKKTMGIVAQTARKIFHR